CTSGAPLLSWIGSFEATSEPKEVTFEAWIPRGHMLEVRPADATLRKAKFANGQVGAGEGTPQNVAGLALHSLTIQQVHPGGDVRTVRDRLFGKDVAVTVDRRSKELSIDYKNPAQDAAKQVRSFARRAFRRSVDEQSLQPYLKLLRESMDAGQPAAVALQATYRAILCSPRFMYFVEPPGDLDDDAIATRLSYLICNSMPDWPLLKLAKEQKLRDPIVIAGEIDRLLKTRRGKEFVTDFADQWLDLCDIAFTEPDRKRHGDFDVVVQNAMLAETHMFLQEMINRDAPASNLVNARHTYLNGRLARYYGIDGVDGDTMQRVRLDRDSVRGGLLSQGAILKVTANGTNTSPVLRGVWVADRILGQHIPPPPENVPAIEPDIRGAKTIREMLAKHRDNDSCASCHRNIDPNGFALENFDAAGQWRDRYIRIDRGKARRALAVDPSYTLSDGCTFETFQEYRDLIASDPRPIARNFAEKLIVYGTGAPITFADRVELDKLVDQNKDNGYGVRSLLKSVVTSPLFLKK
ncbi:MAG: DUF1592 domain-containing protein, partial [Pirellulaceae bacterium]|nr:DUF1592 domain-containing protein [Pirellulaceae bacterium]